MGMIAIIFIQRAIHKILISVFLSREFKHDETNRAWWTGKWYGRGLGTHALSQPAREFVVKIIELSLWSSDFLLCHLLLFMLAIPLFIPYFDRLHAAILCAFRFHFLPVFPADYFYLNSLVASLPSDPCTFVFSEAKTATKTNRYKVWFRLRAYFRHLRRLDRSSYVLVLLIHGAY